MLNNCKIGYRIAIYHWFDSTVNVHSNHQQAADKGDEQTVEIDAHVSESSIKTIGWRGLQISFCGIKQVT